MPRPKIEIDLDQLEKLCAMQCTVIEICGWFDITKNTLFARVLEHYEQEWGEFYEEKKGRGKVALRRRQFEAAMAGSVPMLIWLGKQWLNQMDRLADENRQTPDFVLSYHLDANLPDKV